jgi:hypothetical protein
MNTNPAFAKKRAQTMQQITSFIFYPVTINKDDTIMVEDVTPGDYQLLVSIAPSTNALGLPDGAKPINLVGTVKIPVSTDPVAGIFDAGDVQLEPVPSSP